MLLTANGQPVLLDFGAAVCAQAAGEANPQASGTAKAANRKLTAVPLPLRWPLHTCSAACALRTEALIVLVTSMPLNP
jgi:hypothetical protein